MEVSPRLNATTRDDWRAWLTANHASQSEIWLIVDSRSDQPTLSYLDSVEEAICFGWIDGLAKRISEHETAQRFTPRRPQSHWTELNKARARRLIELGQMTEAGQRRLPDLATPFTIAPDILEAIEALPAAKAAFATFPDLYIRIRIGYIEEMRKQPMEFARRLQHFLRKTADGKQFGNWNDSGRLTGSADLNHSTT
ncbi:YdeI/OmpD-associated family protein [Tuwongella immobilis]|uniref:Thymidylate synthase n=1 Tax=Tuwongella immobilis TaxID=692036 RepID=A0A6C2YS53_9BACT|nr:YdeI/OmpD-associated family protein [Tuwongella immobilis]VIP03712.1 Uncharacterized protein OS=Acaryochloris marina (strain MBIC 11017) GN=AM1_3263 PE=4 SV=1: OmdA [Tuwongella immobilis]VTS04792.1 Uncharacterized protein OS=Acaryochloris marina (strain MBIC 11017) GN=AM1_3263 PE=4 SV=1: OmdA [Tuwongella immobilis]